MSYIRTIPPIEATGEVRAMYQRQHARFGYVPNYARAFSWRPELMPLWSDLLAEIRKHVDRRRFEIATLAAALALRNSYCSLAHGRALAEMLTDAEVRIIARTALEAVGDSAARVDMGSAWPPCGLSDLDLAIVRYAARSARAPEAIVADDVDELRAHGLTDPEIFDLAAIVAARAFFTRLLDALGVEPDAAYHGIGPALTRTLTVGRPIEAPAPRDR